MSDHDFCRALLRETRRAVNKIVPVEERKSAWAYKYDYSDDVEFHVPVRGFFWHGGGCCKWHARHEGWVAFMEEFYKEELDKFYEQEDTAS